MQDFVNRGQRWCGIDFWGEVWYNGDIAILIIKPEQLVS